MESSGTNAGAAAAAPAPGPVPASGPVYGPEYGWASSVLAEPVAPDLVTVPTRQGLEAVDIIRRAAPTPAGGVGPVLHDDSGDTLGFLVPPGTADAWDLPGSACTQTDGRGMRFGDVPAADSTGWLLPPEVTGSLTDPAVLRAALGEAARLIEAADNCR
ncbi:hypothetical protein [Streptomyces antimicrobicus]|uniref:Uncharacterized protein n=1 Tax=Streptomyces antimicrobicus TaxID=2883108 RepID=A0ABS8B869_9ACTN|nr:hypothetical protein [Streptomyces antimicrobicus]MCB5180772.1 hypothetical protein [Streptomyces antimicrobicus]